MAESERPRVQIVNPAHPHFPEHGVFTGETIRMKFGRGEVMAKVLLDNCRHGTDACYVSPGDIREEVRNG